VWLAEPVRREVLTELDAKSRGEWHGSDLDQHRTLNRLKVAAVLGILQLAQRPGQDPATIALLGETVPDQHEEAVPDAGIYWPDRPDSYAITEEDWQLAGVVVEKSDATREALIEAGAEHARRRNRARAQEEAERAVIVDEGRDAAMGRRAADTIMRKLDREGGEASAADLKRALRSDLRPSAQEALDALAAIGRIEQVDTHRSDGTGARYRVKL
jgi:hypothetical protein